MTKAKHIDIEKKSDDSYEVTMEYSNGYKFIFHDCIVTPFPEDLNNMDESGPMRMTLTLKRGDKGKMKYWVVDCITGVKSGRGFTSLDKAKAKRDKMNAEDKAEGGSGNFWVVIDEDGNEVI